MADISKITLPDDTTYNIKDKNARNFTNTPYYEQDEEALMFQLGESYMTGEQDNQPYSFRAAGGSADIGNREYDKIIGGTVAWNQLVRDGASTNEVDFADIVTVDDAVEDAAGVKVKIEPVQDLHGYDHPWPAGGTKNKMPNAIPKTETINGITFKLDDFGVFTVTGTATDEAICDFPLGFSFVILDGDPKPKIAFNNTQGISSVTFRFFNNTSQVDSWTLLPVNRVSEYSSMRGKTCNSYRIIVSSGTTVNMTFSPVIVENSVTDYTYIRYSNVCSISGFEGLTVWDDPVRGGTIKWNQLSTPIDNAVEHKGVTVTPNSDGSVSIVGTTTASGALAAFKNFATIKNHKYLVMAKGLVSGISIYTDIGGLIAINSTIRNATEDKSNSNVTLRTDTGVTYSAKIWVSTFDLTQMFGSTIADYIYSLEQANAGAGVAWFKALFPADYYPYNEGETTTVSAVNGGEYRRVPISWQTEAGTVYGGELTVNTDGSGSLVVDRKRIVIDQNSNLIGGGNTGYEGLTGSNRYILESIKGTYNIQYDGCVSNILERQLSTIWASPDSFLWKFTFNGSQLHMVFENAVVGITDEMSPSQRTQAIKAWLANNNIEIIALLATPITYTLNASEIRTLLGTNNIWSDAGQTALTYTGTGEHLTLENGRKYLTRISGTDSMLLGSGQENTVEKGTNNVFDLTQMFGTTIADYIYSLETATPGAGVAWFRKLFPKPYYEYNAGELMSVQAVAHKLVGFNAWDEEWELGIINTTTGEETDSNSNIRSKNYIHVIPGATYYFKLGTTDISNNVVFYDAEKNYVAASGEHINDTFTVPEDAHYMKFYMSTNYGSTYLSNICINLSGDGERDGEYEEYKMHSYPLDSSLVLRGIPKLDANNQLYYDGDEYQADGTVTRKYAQETITIVGAGPTRARMAIATTLKNRYPYNRMVAVICDKIITNMTSETDDVNYISCRLSQDSNKTMWFFFPLNVVSTIDEARAWFTQNKPKVVYELATPMTETAEPYDNPQIVDPEGTEEYITTSIVFVGHETKY